MKIKEAKQSIIIVYVVIEYYLMEKIKSNDVKIDIPNKIYFHNNEEKTNEEKMCMKLKQYL